MAVFAAIPAIAGFIGWTLVGAGMFGVTVKLPIMTALVRMVVGYLLSLVMVWVLALIVAALAPTFGGTKDPLAVAQARRVCQHRGARRRDLRPAAVAVACSPSVASLYSIYLLYTGIAVMMRCPP